MKFIIYKDGKGEWRWRLKARNGRIVADSGEGYKRKAGAEKGINAIRDRDLVFAPIIEEAQ